MTIPVLDVHFVQLMETITLTLDKENHLFVTIKNVRSLPNQCTSIGFLLLLIYHLMGDNSNSSTITQIGGRKFETIINFIADLNDDNHRLYNSTYRFTQT